MLLQLSVTPSPSAAPIRVSTSPSTLLTHRAQLGRSAGTGASTTASGHDIAPLTLTIAELRPTGREDVMGASNKELHQTVDKAAIPDINTAASLPSGSNGADTVSVEEQSSWATDSASNISGDYADPGWFGADWQSSYAEYDDTAAARLTRLPTKLALCWSRGVKKNHYFRRLILRSSQSLKTFRAVRFCQLSNHVLNRCRNNKQN